MRVCQEFVIQGEDVVKAVKDSGFDVICIPGPCAAITALVSSGISSSSFIFGWHANWKFK